VKNIGEKKTVSTNPRASQKREEGKRNGEKEEDSVGGEVRRSGEESDRNNHLTVQYSRRSIIDVDQGEGLLRGELRLPREMAPHYRSVEQRAGGVSNRRKMTKSRV